MPTELAPGLVLGNQVLSSLYVHEPSVLYWAALQQFKSRPSKSRAIALYDVFISVNGPWEGTMAESDPANAVQTGFRAVLEQQHGANVAQRDMAKTMGISRYFHSSDRVPPITQFDDYNKAIKLESSNGPLGNFLRSPQTRVPMSGWEGPAGIAAKALGAAGFDLKALGIRNVKQSP